LSPFFSAPFIEDRSALASERLTFQIEISSARDLYSELALHPVRAPAGYVLASQIPGGRTSVYDGGVFKSKVFSQA
jgi:hypothetical protein